MKHKLKKALKHGDKGHQQWVNEVIDSVFDDKPIPAYDGHEAQITDLQNQIQQLERKPTKGTALDYQGKIATQQEEMSGLRRELKIAQKKHGIFRALVEEMESIVVPLEPLPTQVIPQPKDKIEEHFVMHLSDEHADEIVLPHQVGGLENFNFNVALCRAEKYIDTLLEWKATLAKHHFPVLHILSYGDHTSGEIHDAKERSEYRNQFRNSLAIGQMQALMFRELAPHFHKIYVYCVAGNHGRRSQKKDFHGAWNNWDYLISEIAKLHCRDIKNIQFAIPDAYSMNIDINGWASLLNMVMV